MRIPSLNLSRAIAPILAAAVCLLLALLILALLGFPTTEVLSILWNRILWVPDPELRHDRWAQVLRRATPILLTGLAITVAFRASVWNIGAQGQYLLGAIAATAVGVYLSLPPGLILPLILIAGMAGGAVLAVIAALLDWLRRVPVVLSTLLLNFIAFEILRFLLQGPMRKPGQEPVSEILADPSRLPMIPGTTLHSGFLVAIAAAAAVSILIHRTTFGFRLRVVGENPTAARFAGIHVPLTSLLTLSASGALAGLAGAVEVSGVTHQLLLGDANSGFGFTGIAVALLGRLSPLGVIAAAVFFGFLNSAAPILQAEMGLPVYTAQALQGMIIILMLVLTHPATVRRFRRSRLSVPSRLETND